MLEAEELRELLGAANVRLRAMSLLGLNCGYGNHDLVTLKQSALDRAKGWVNFPRPKTGIPRRCPLWPETVAAIRAVLEVRPTPQRDEDSDYVFLTSRGNTCLSGGLANPLGNEYTKLVEQLKLYRAGIGFYTLRHVFRTIADAACDPVAIDLIMGHSDPSMGGHYRERVEDSRLVAVADHVRQWLWPKPAEGPPQADTPAKDNQP